MAGETEVPGKDLVLSYGGVAILGCRNFALRRSAQSIDAGHAGSFPAPRKLPGEYAWSIEQSGVLMMNGANSDAAIDALEAAMLAGTAVATITCSIRGKARSGDVIVTRLDEDGEYKGVATYAITLEGAEALATS
ncbi:MAG: phage tail tube protein [Armatimonadota bacterium]